VPLLQSGCIVEIKNRTPLAQKARETKKWKIYGRAWRQHHVSPQSLASVGMRHDGSPACAAAPASQREAPASSSSRQPPDLAVLVASSCVNHSHTITPPSSCLARHPLHLVSRHSTYHIHHGQRLRSSSVRYAHDASPPALQTSQYSLFIQSSVPMDTYSRSNMLSKPSSAVRPLLHPPTSTSVD
jgi:hypothetical protein